MTMTWRTPQFRAGGCVSHLQKQAGVEAHGLEGVHEGRGQAEEPHALPTLGQLCEEDLVQHTGFVWGGGSFGQVGHREGAGWRGEGVRSTQLAGRSRDRRTCTASSDCRALQRSE
jgi:hypothetical protein